MAPIATSPNPSFLPESARALPDDYVERVYAGVLGKLIGVYVGRPFEGWTHQMIMAELGHIKGYVHEKFGVPCVVTDDDVSGTFAFVRALEEHPGQAITSELIGKTWLNQVVEKKSVFWWGGKGISTEHTAYLNLKHGIPAPRSGSIEQNGKTVAEQIGAQIFIDGWAMVAPGRPDFAARLAEEAGKVSHDGESVYAAMLWAAMESEAFVTKDIEHLLDTGLRYIPRTSLIFNAIAEVRAWVKSDDDWLKTRQRIEDKYGYDKFHGMCHVVPNHLTMIMSVLYAPHDFDLVMEIVNTCGWDTDCNSGNVGCLVAIMNGMSSFDGKVDWRRPVADRAIISSGDNGYSMNNAARIAGDLVNMGRRLVGKAPLPAPKDGAQFHFTLPGSVQGFVADDPSTPVSQADRGLIVQIDGEGSASTGTHAASDIFEMGSTYPLSSSPLVYTGQQVSAVVEADVGTIVKFRIKYYDESEKLVNFDSDVQVELSAQSGPRTLHWTVPPIHESRPIANLGIVCTSSGKSAVKLDRLAITGVPNMVFERPKRPVARFWDMQWIQGVTDYRGFDSSIWIANDLGRGIISCGTRDWDDYAITIPELSIKVGGPSGVAIRVQGLRRYYALLLHSGEKVSIIKVLDDEESQLASVDFAWKLDQKYEVKLEVEGSEIRAQIGGRTLVARDDRYKSGAMGLVVSDGGLSVGQIHVRPVVA